MVEEFEQESKWMSLDCDIVCELYRYINFTIDDLIRKIHQQYNEIIINEYNKIIAYSLMLIEEDEYRVYYKVDSREVVLSIENFYTPGFTVIATNDKSEDLAYIWMELDQYGKL